MIQNCSLNSNLYASKLPKSLVFGQNTSTPSTTTDKKQPQQPKSSVGVLTALAIFGGAAAAGVLGHKVLVSNKLEKELEEVKKASNNVLPNGEERVFSVTVKKLEETALYKKFSKSGKSLFGFIEDSDAPQMDVKQFLFGVTSHPDKAEQFIEEITADPRKSQEITATLVKKIGGQKNFLDWYFAPKGYQQSYDKHIAKVFEQAKKPDDLFKVSPNWQYYKVCEKFGQNFTVGDLPEGFGSVENYRDAVPKIMRAVSWKNTDAPINGIKVLKEFSSGCSGKAAVLVEAGDKKYVIKYHHDLEIYNPKIKQANDQLRSDPETYSVQEHFFDKYKENEMMKSDSAFMDAQIDSYLNQNNSQNVAKLHFFDSATKSSVYELVDGKPLEAEDATIVNLNQKLPDFRSLGVIYNDVKPENFVVKDGVPKSIDSGESGFIDVLKPGCSCYHCNLPNLNGLDLPACLAGINMDKI